MSSIVAGTRQKTLRHPPGPTGNWPLGVMRDFRADALSTFLHLRETYGDALRFRFLLHFHGHAFFHPDHVEHILVHNNRNYVKMRGPGNELLRPVVGNGLLTSDGDFWLRQRRLAQPAFHRRRIAAFSTTMTGAAGAMLDRWADRAGTGQPWDVAEEMRRLTLEIAGRTLFSVDLTGEAETIGDAFVTASQKVIDYSAIPYGSLFLRVPFMPGVRTLNRNVAALDSVVNGLIAERRQRRREGQGESADLLDMLMDARDEETGATMTDEQLRDEVMTLLLAGHETTALALSWTFYLLSQHPEVRERLEAEVDAVLGGRVPTMDDIHALAYTSQVIDEALRLYPPAYLLSRFVVENDVVDGYDIPAGSVLSLSPYVTHRHPEFWPEPERFDPDRFTPEQQAGRPRFAYFPFGGGPRQCIGNRFALTEAVLVLAMVTQRYRLDLVPGHPIALEPLITLRPKHGILVTSTGRS
ncbi:MAG: cytochrome P450 [Chloroflexi bacterium]|nr:cytochrome P450 [Chloroflexota bacterium]